MFLPRSKKLHWTYHARAKMAYYKLSEQRMRRVLNSPKRVEEGIAPKTMAMMQPVSFTYRYVNETVPSPFDKLRVNSTQRSRGTPSRSAKPAGGHRQETWNHEIWVMIQDEKSQRKIISAWRYPGRSKPRSEAAKDAIMSAYKEYMASAEK